MSGAYYRRNWRHFWQSHILTLGCPKNSSLSPPDYLYKSPKMMSSWNIVLHRNIVLVNKLLIPFQSGTSRLRAEPTAKGWQARKNVKRQQNSWTSQIPRLITKIQKTGLHPVTSSIMEKLSSISITVVLQPSTVNLQNCGMGESAYARKVRLSLFIYQNIL